MEKLNVFDYGDYRIFLSDHLRHRRNHNPNFTCRSWCRVLGLGSPATLNMILRGHRNPGHGVLEKLNKYFSFDLEETEYFSTLVSLAKAETDPEKKLRLIDQLAKLSPLGAPKIIDQYQFSIISNWYHFAILEMSRSHNFKSNPAWIARKLKGKITAKVADDALISLQKTGMLVQTEDKEFEPTVNQISTPPDIAAVAVKRYQSQVLDLAKEALATPIENREISSSVFNIDPNDMPQIKEQLRKMKASLMKKYEKTSGTQTVQFNLQLFPLTDN